MNKRIKYVCTWLVLVLYSFSQCIQGHAEEGRVSYQGQAEQFVFIPGSSYSPTDLFTAFKEVMPGDSLLESIEVRNDSADTIKVYMRAAGSHSFEDVQQTKVSDEFLSQLQISVTQRNQSGLCDTPANLAGGLADWVCLGTLQKGADVILDVTLRVPLELGNAFQETAGYLDWQFKVEEIPAQTPQEPQENPQEEPDKPAKPTQAYTAVKTGDTYELWYYTGVAVLSAAALLLIRKRRVKVVKKSGL